MTRVQLNLTPFPFAPETQVMIDGVDMTHRVASLVLTAGVGELTTLTVEYPCTEVTTMEGDVEVVHYCPHESSEEQGDE